MYGITSFSHFFFPPGGLISTHNAPVPISVQVSPIMPLSAHTSGIFQHQQNLHIHVQSRVCVMIRCG